MTTIEDLTKLLIKFRDDRNWKQFHNPKDLAISISIESGELLELFQWKSPEEVTEYLKIHKEKAADELADVLSYTLLLSNALGINLSEALLNKTMKNEQKYPIEKSNGKHTKYTEL